MYLYIKMCIVQQAWLAQSVEHETLNLRVVGSSPTLGESFFSFFFYFFKEHLHSFRKTAQSMKSNFFPLASST